MVSSEQRNSLPVDSHVSSTHDAEINQGFYTQQRFCITHFITFVKSWGVANVSTLASTRADKIPPLYVVNSRSTDSHVRFSESLVVQSLSLSISFSIFFTYTGIDLQKPLICLISYMAVPSEKASIYARPCQEISSFYIIIFCYNYASNFYIAHRYVGTGASSQSWRLFGRCLQFPPTDHSSDSNPLHDSTRNSNFRSQYTDHPRPPESNNFSLSVDLVLHWQRNGVETRALQRVVLTKGEHMVLDIVNMSPSTIT